MVEYVQHYGFSENPFALSADPKFFFPAESHREAFAALLYGINQRKGFVLLLAEEGIGKTTLIRHLIGTLDSNVKTIFFPQGQIAFELMLKEILINLEIPITMEAKGSMLHDLYSYLIQSLEKDENVAIIIDEAHNISPETIEELRLLSNLETSKSKLLQIVIVGEPKLKAKLRSKIIRQINQRIVVSSQISPLTREESLRYIDHRLKIVGSSSSEIFTDEALSLICRYSKGIPRTINILCGNALSVGYGSSEKKISASIVRKIRKKEVLTETRSPNQNFKMGRGLPRKFFSAFSALAIFVMLIFFTKDYVKHLLTAQKVKSVIEFSSPKDKAETSLRKSERHVATEGSPKTANREVASVSPETPQNPASMATTASQPDTGIHLKAIVEVKKGTTLSMLALKYYNDANLTFIDHILKLNPEITNPDLILVDQKIKIPEITGSLLLVQSSDDEYKVHLETFEDSRYAVRYIDEIGLPRGKVEVVPQQVSRKVKWYRVLAGPYSTKTEGLRAIEEMQQRGLLPFLR